jgi:uncharacterized delta-60 repeat protein
MKRILLFTSLTILSNSFGQAVSFDPAFNGGNPLYVGEMNNYQKLMVIDNENYYITNFNSSADEYKIDKLTNTSGNASLSNYANNGDAQQFVDFDRDANGNIYAVGISYINNGWVYEVYTRIQKLISANTNDPSFNSGDEVLFTDAFDYYPEFVRVLSDGKIIVAGKRNNMLTYVMRFNANGTIDTGFGTNGIQIINGVPFFKDLIVLSNGKMLFSGTMHNVALGASKVYIGRLNSDGTLDATFGTDGMTLLAFGQNNLPTEVTQCIINSSGEILVTGYGFEFGNPTNRAVGFVAKLNQNGAIETTFGNASGFFNPDALFSQARSNFQAIEILNDGNLAVAGTRYNAALGETDPLIVFLNSTGVVNTNFGNSGVSSLQTNSYSGPDITIYELKQQADGKLVYYLATTNSQNPFDPANNYVGRVLFQTNNLVVSTASLNSFSQTLGAPSSEQTFTVSGSNLTNHITVTAPTNYEVSLTSGSGYASNIQVNQTSGSVPTTTIYVRLNATVVGAHSGDITLTSGALNETVAVTGNTTEGTSGLGDNKLTQLAIFPNPGSGVITLAVNQPTTAVFMSANGANLANLELNGETSIDVSSYASGVYFIRTAEGQTVKFIKH